MRWFVESVLTEVRGALAAEKDWGGTQARVAAVAGHQLFVRDRGC